MKRKHIIFYLFQPLLLQWGISFLVQVLALLLLGEIGSYALELTTVISFATVPVAAYFLKKDREERGYLERTRVSLNQWGKVAALGVVSCITLNMGITLLDIQRFSPAYQVVSETIYGASYIVQFLGTVIAAPMVEEFIYRGLLYGRIREFAPTSVAAVLSSVIFGLCHGNLVQFVFAFGIGVLLCRVYETYGSLRLSIWMHTIVNLTSLSLTWMLK